MNVWRCYHQSDIFYRREGIGVDLEERIPLYYYKTDHTLTWYIWRALLIFEVIPETIDIVSGHTLNRQS